MIVVARDRKDDRFWREQSTESMKEFDVRKILILKISFPFTDRMLKRRGKNI